MFRIRYISEHLIARAFEHTVDRNHWDEHHGLESRQFDILGHNPEFEVRGRKNTDALNDPIKNVGAMSGATR